MRAFFLLLWLTVCSFSAFSALPDAVAQLEKTAVKERFPNADTVLLYNVEKKRYDTAGLERSSDEYYQKVLTENGRVQMRNMAIPFNTVYDRVNVDFLSVIRNGKEIAVDVQKNSKVAIDSSQMASNIYDPAHKVLQISLPDLQVNDTVKIRISRRTVKNRIPGVWSDYVTLQGDMPILYYRVEIDAPKALPLRSIAVKDEVKGCITSSSREENGRILYLWEAKDVPQVIPEPDMPPIYACCQRLLVSTAASWTEISRWYYSLCRPRLDRKDEAMKQKTAELIAGCKSEDDKIRAVFNFVSQQIRYMGLTYEDDAPGYEPHDVDLTFKARYGVCRDKAALLVSMLEIAGFKAYPVLFMAGVPKDSDVPNSYFNHAITAAEKSDGTIVLMDPTNESARDLLPPTSGNCSYLLAKPDGDQLRLTPPPDPRLNALEINSRFAFNGYGDLHGKISMAFTGVNDMIYRDAFSRWTPEERDQYFSRALNTALAGAVIRRIKVLPDDIRDTSKKLIVELECEVKQPLFFGRSSTLLPLPELGDAVGASGLLLGPFALEKRKFDLEIPATFLVEENFQLQLPEYCRIEAMPGNAELGSSKTAVWQRSLQAKGNLLTGKRRFSVNRVVFTPKEYLEVKKLLRDAERFKRRFPVVKMNFSALSAADAKKVFPGAGVLVLKEHDKIKLHSASAWSRIRERKLLVLDYAGMKDASELKLYFNPAWEKVHVQGIVRSPDGKVRELKKEEINIMDAAWNASAPRYPGSKVLVANFPGVQAGSVIETRVEREYFDRDLFSMTAVFGSHVPVAEKQFSLQFPEHLQLRNSSVPGDVRFSTAQKNGVKTLSWSMDNLPRVLSERSQAPLEFFLPRVSVGTGKWQTFAAAVKKRFSDACRVRDNPRAAALAKQLAAGKTSRIRQITAIRDHVSRNVRLAGPALNEVPMKLSAPDVILASGYGNSADRAVLLKTMLDAVGVASEIMPVSDMLYTPEAVKMLSRFPGNIFSGVLVYVPEENIFLNDDSEYARPGTVGGSGRIALHLDRGKLESVQPADRCENGVVQRQVDIQLQPDLSARITVTEKYIGKEFESMNRMFSRFTPELRRRYFESAAMGISRFAVISGVPESNFTVYPGVVKYVVDCKNFLNSTGRFAELDLPLFRTFSQAVGNIFHTRRTPFIRQNARRISVDYRIELPDNLSLSRQRSARREQGNYGSGIFTCEFRCQPRRIELECRLILPAGVVSGQDHDNLFELRRMLDSVHVSKMIFEKNKGK